MASGAVWWTSRTSRHRPDKTLLIRRRSACGSGHLRFKRCDAASHPVCTESGNSRMSETKYRYLILYAFSFDGLFASRTGNVFLIGEFVGEPITGAFPIRIFCAVLLATTLLVPSTYAGEAYGPLAPGKPAGVQKAQSETATAVLI